MSRYSKRIFKAAVRALEIEPKPKTQYRLIWGYDRPPSEYFIHLEAIPIDPPKDDEDNDDDYLVFAISNVFTLKEHPVYPKQTKFKTTDLLVFLMDAKQAGADIPQHHIDAIGLDLPI